MSAAHVRAIERRLEIIRAVVPADAIRRELTSASSVTAAARRLGVTRPWLDRFARGTTDQTIRVAFRECVNRGKRHLAAKDAA